MPSNYSSEAAELYELPHKNVFKWTEGHTEEIKRLQKMLSRAKPLAMNYSLVKTIVTCDASKNGIIGEVSHLQKNGEYKTVFYRSLQEFEKSMTFPNWNY